MIRPSHLFEQTRPPVPTKGNLTSMIKVQVDFLKQKICFQLNAQAKFVFYMVPVLSLVLPAVGCRAHWGWLLLPGRWGWRVPHTKAKNVFSSESFHSSDFKKSSLYGRSIPFDKVTIHLFEIEIAWLNTVYNGTKAQLDAFMDSKGWVTYMLHTWRPNCQGDS